MKPKDIKDMAFGQGIRISEEKANRLSELWPETKRVYKMLHKSGKNPEILVRVVKGVPQFQVRVRIK